MKEYRVNVEFGVTMDNAELRSMSLVVSAVSPIQAGIAADNLIAKILNIPVIATYVSTSVR